MDKNFFLNDLNLDTEKNNFFQHNENNITSNSLKPYRRLNDTDAKILEDDSYKDVENELVKLEVKISRLEDSISDVEKQIKLANDLKDSDKYLNLINYKTQLLSELNSLTKEYNEMSVSAKFADILKFSKNNIFSKIFNLLSKEFSSKLLSKLPKKISSVYEIKKSLSTLENLNKSVDELMSLQTPYGESEARYEQISKYITKANYIQSNISKHLK